nr:reverse transcriptase domain-containing protein [Tanacetum cinerariifolium]
MAAVRDGKSTMIDCRVPTQYQEGYSPVRQKKYGHASECAKAIEVEVQKLVEAGILREVYYYVWLSNPVMKSIRKSKPFATTPLSASWTPTKATIKYRWPNKMRKRQLSTPYTRYIDTQKMPFGLKNTGATYQRLVDKAFDRQVGQNLKKYVDDLVFKSHTKTELLWDIEKTYRTLRKINMKLNPKKCTFGAAEGMFLGYMVNPKGLKTCPDKTDAVLQLPSLQTIKEVQSLNGKMASLNRFISKSAEKYLLLFKTLKKCIKK